MITIVILGILVSISLPIYSRTRENFLDKGANADLKLIYTAQISYKLDMGSYYPSTGSDGNITNINSNLKLSLPSGSNRNWNYTVWSTGCGRVTRYNGPDTRSWYLTIDDADGEPNSGAGCP
jgi:type II secretory pathway pseudopilin PulG